MERIDPPELMTLEQLALLLQKSIPAVRALIRRGVVPETCYFKLGHQLRFRTAEVYHWLNLPRARERAA